MNLELTLSPPSTAILVFDMLEGYRAAIEDAGTIPPAVQLVEGARRLGSSIFYAAADHRPDGLDAARCATDTDSDLQPWSRSDREPDELPRITCGSPEARVLVELTPYPGDTMVPKHRWNAFRGTHLDLTLRRFGVQNLVLLGGSTHVGIASTAYAARDLDYQLIIAADACHGAAEQKEFFLERVFPRMCRVRSVADILAALGAGTSPAVQGAR